MSRQGILAALAAAVGAMVMAAVGAGAALANWTVSVPTLAPEG